MQYNNASRKYVLRGLEIYYKKLEQINKSIIKAITYPIGLEG